AGSVPAGDREHFGMTVPHRLPVIGFIRLQAEVRVMRLLDESHAVGDRPDVTGGLAGRSRRAVAQLDLPAVAIREAGRADRVRTPVRIAVGHYRRTVEASRHDRPRVGLVVFGYLPEVIVLELHLLRRETPGPLPDGELVVHDLRRRQQSRVLQGDED